MVDRVVTLAEEGPTIYAVPGSPLVGEFAVALLRETTEIEVIPGESFLDAILAAVGYDPLDRGLRILNGHQLPEPLVIDGPTVVAHLDQPVVLADAICQPLPGGGEDTRAIVVVNAGGPNQVLVEQLPRRGRLPTGRSAHLDVPRPESRGDPGGDSDHGQPSAKNAPGIRSRPTRA